MRVSIDTHDMLFKLKNARKFLEKGDMVKFTIQFKGREVTKPELGERLVEAILKEMEDIVEVQQKPARMGNQQIMIVSRRKDYVPKDD